MNSFSALTFTIALFWIAHSCTAQNNPESALTSGVVKYTMTSANLPDTAIMTVHFQPGKGAVILLSKDSSGNHSIFDFEKDSLFSVMRGEGSVMVVPLKLSEVLEMAQKQSSLVSKDYPDTKEILGYQCRKFEASLDVGDEKAEIVGWATTQIQTRVRFFLDETLTPLGLPLELTLTVPSISPEPAMIYRAIAIDTVVNPQVFVVPQQK